MAIDTTLDSATKTLNIKVSGHFDFTAHEGFRRATDLAKENVNNIIVDLSKVAYIDSSALGMLLVLRKAVDDSKRAVRIKNVKPEVKKILEIAKFEDLFTIE